MLKKKNKYYKHSATVEKTEKNQGTNDDKNNKQIIQLKNLANKSSEEYVKSIENVNKVIEEFDYSVPNKLISLQQNEENRIHFVKTTLEKFIKQAMKNQTISKENMEQMIGLVNNINSDIDIQVFVDTHKGRYRGGIKEEFISYQKWKDKRKEINEIEARDADDNYEEILAKAINFIMSGEDTDSDSSLSEIESEEPDFIKISEAFKNSNLRIYFLDLLESKKHKYLLSQQKMNTLVSYLKSLLTSIIIDDDKDPCVFCKLLSLLHSFFSDLPQHRRLYLSQFLSSHSI